MLAVKDVTDIVDLESLFSAKFLQSKNLKPVRPVFRTERFQSCIWKLCEMSRSVSCHKGLLFTSLLCKIY
ncbi:unnamed protein product [Schistosoma intercalatum]|nr:unnamed protein product [Schistosoma intercalatum]